MIAYYLIKHVRSSTLITSEVFFMFYYVINSGKGVGKVV